MRITRRPLIGIFPAAEPTVTRLELSASERATLQRAAALLDAIRDKVAAECGEDVSNRDPWIDLVLGASGIRDILEDDEIL